jgi:NAD(P)-dependent dehydrogenase (short-subunit alcohol dehydrogenase family)
MRGLAGKRIIVASGATGIGAATARRLAAEDAKVLIGDINETGLAETVAAIRASGGEAGGIRYDLDDPASIEALIAACVERYGGLDGLANIGADIASSQIELTQNLLDMDLALWERSFRINTLGHALAIKAALPHMARAGGGSIVGISSGATHMGPANIPAYASTKAALHALLRHVASAFGKQNIRCNYVSPGWIMTESAKMVLSDEKRDALIAAMPLTRLGTADDIAATVAFFLSDDAEWITGQVLSVNGGTVYRD